MKLFRNIALALALIIGIGAAPSQALATQVLLNNTYSKLTAAISAGATTVNVTAGDGVKFAAATGGNTITATLVKISGFREIAWEIVTVTARSTDALTITRAQEGTTALAFSVGDVIDVRMTAGLTPGAIGAAAKADNLSVFAATTSAQLAGILSDESGTGVFCMTVSCQMTTPNIGAATATTLVGTDTTDATSSTAAAVKTAGGLAVAKKLYVGTNASVGGTLAVTGTSTLAIEAVIAPTLLNSWANYGGTIATGYSKDAFGIVHLQGQIYNGSSVGATMFTLPAGYRPTTQTYFIVLSAGAIGNLSIAADGTVSLAAGSVSATTSLNGISFRTN